MTFFFLKVPTSAFTIKNLLRQYAKQVQLQPTHVVEVGLGGLGQLGGPGLARHLRILVSHLV